MLIQTEGKRTPKKDQLEPPLFSEAVGTVISRAKIKNGATFVVPPIPQARAGDVLDVYSETLEWLWSSRLTLSAMHPGKPLEFKVQAAHFNNTDWADAFYVLRQGDANFISQKSIYEVTD
ncbi:hypothetical protein [Pseudomonas moraviensis]|uniref:hypothetical protein n=1 Tax=Pseudomonas moraviensis TaxID=321662 RepID=UPI0022C99D86|nr:hypothetical protein [Pseudomonas moraviensis]GLH39007.1 hypothetical protein RS1P1_32910 [Pseudomonas moraviensis]